MEFTAAYTRALNQAISFYNTPGLPSYTRQAVEDNWYSFGYISVPNPHKEVPVVALGDLALTNYGEQVINLKLLNQTPIQKRTADSIIKEFFGKENHQAGELIKCVTHKNDVYYGGAGIILDGYKNLLLYLTIDKERKNLNINISPDVLFRDDMICKSIMSKVSKIYMTKAHHWCSTPRVDIGYCTPEIHIVSLAGVLKHPVPPKHGILDELPELLINNIDEIFNTL